MSCRRHGSKPALALWMLVAIADLAILTAATGVVTMLLIITGLVLIAGGVAAARQLAKRDVPAREAVARRRA